MYGSGSPARKPPRTPDSGSATPSSVMELLPEARIPSASQSSCMTTPGELGGTERREGEERVEAGGDLGGGAAPDAQGEPDVLGDGHVAEEGVVLDHQPDVPLAGGAGRDLVAGVAHLAGVGGLEPGQDPEQG